MEDRRKMGGGGSRFSFLGGKKQVVNFHRLAGCREVEGEGAMGGVTGE